MNRPFIATALASFLSMAASAAPQDETSAWQTAGKAALLERLSHQPNTGKAKNVILFVGDGMGVSTLTASRIYAGQKQGQSGEEGYLSFENFPYTALVKTYNTNAQIADSAGTASALNTGVKTRIGVINTKPSHPANSCVGTGENALETFAEFAEKRGMSTGVVSTARLTHATPAAVFAVAASRGFENDTNLPKGIDPAICPDIASQITRDLGGDGLEIALGGGRGSFVGPDQGGRRQDGRDITQEWVDRRSGDTYVASKADLLALDPTTENRVLGLFANSHLPYKLDRKADDIDLVDMTEYAVKNLEARGTGYYLMVEAGRIDHAHHWGNAKRALEETDELSAAVARTLELVDLDETLILVTADHSHVFTIAGYARRGNPILGLSVSPEWVGVKGGEPQKASDGKPYTTLGYTNGPGAIEGSRADLSDVDVEALNFKQQSAIPMPSETHGGEDVALFAIGPWAHLARGTMEQNLIYHIMRYAVEGDTEQD